MDPKLDTNVNVRKKKKSLLLNAALMGIVTASTATLLFTLPTAQAKSSASGAKKVKCYGVNKCKGTGDCGGKTHDCAGQNQCSGKGWIKLEKDTCLKIKGGSLKPVKG